MSEHEQGTDRQDGGEGLVSSTHPYRHRIETFRTLPARGRANDEILAWVRAMAEEEDAKGHAGLVSGSIYHGGEEHYEFLAEVFGRFAHANVLQRDMYPSATKFEGEIVAMTAAMLHGEAVAGHHPGEEVCGVITSGGTESLLNPMLVYRERGRELKGITEPQVIIPVTAHVALDKAAHYFGIELLHAPVRDDFLVDVDWVRAHVTPNTVAVVGSAGNYPHGLIDPIEELSSIALDHDIGLHVDGCLGGFLLPWAERLGYDVPRFDFRLPGVTSISADTHKFGYALKGTSVLLYRNRDLRRFQYFAYPTWPGGLYASPGLSGSRSGGLIAATWAAMVSLGEEGYLEIADAIFRTARTIREGVDSIPELEVIGNPTFVVAFRSDVVDVYHVNDALIERGWRLNALQLPPALHFCVTRPNTQAGVAERFVADLREAVDYAKHPPVDAPRSGAVYGLGAVPDGAATLTTLMGAWLDLMHELPPTAG